jgi:hypothetical protein
MRTDQWARRTSALGQRGRARELTDRPLLARLATDAAT